MPFDINESDYGVKLVPTIGALRAGPAEAIQNIPSESLYRTTGKRLLDITLVLLTLPISLPLMIIFAFLVATDGGNPLYAQPRIGQNGRKFRMWKLRTMVPNADAQLNQYLAANPEAKAEWDAFQKLKKDPRITWVGRILRKCSLDELPQLFNVLGGSMSLVGPRPIMLGQKDLYKGSGYYKLRPGLTGPWQVSKRNECDFAGRVAFDDAYNESVSLSTDISVILRTVRVVLRGTGY